MYVLFMNLEWLILCTNLPGPMDIHIKHYFLVSVRMFPNEIINQ